MRRAVWMSTLSLLASPAIAHDMSTDAVVEEIVVTGRGLNLVGEAVSASEGSVGRTELENRPLLRSGDLLEFVPGLVATQHSGSGKAQQYFLRGFNLDHGTDFATSVDAMPVNMRTHGHGHGWTDLNFLIPETVDELTYRKGTYYADVGDFASTGSARFHIADTVPRGIAELTVGDFGYRRGVVVDSMSLGGGDLLYSAEAQTYDGPWTDIREDVRKTSALVRYSSDAGGGRTKFTAMAYANAWNSHDQIPQRAVRQGLITEFGSLDKSAGGESSRYSLSAGHARALMGGEFRGEAYAIVSDLNLFSDFTYFLDDPVAGDQFKQVDQRRIYGFEISQKWRRGKSRWRVGADGRFDDIGRVGLYRTSARRVSGTIREDAVEEGSIGIFVANEVRFTDKLRTFVGVRHDRFDFDVNALSLPANSGTARASRTSLKASLAYRPVKPLDLYLSYGQGFHSNDARGVTTRFDPITGAPTEPADPLVASEGAEVGARLHLGDRIEATAALWSLKLDSELVFLGDTGSTEAGRPSHRQGLEAGLYFPGDGVFSGELEASYTRAEFTDSAAAGRHIPRAIPLVVSGGVTVRKQGYVATVRIRYFSPYPLIEDSRVKSEGSTLVNLRFGKSIGRVGLHLDVLNALDSKDHDIDYLYTSRLPGEASAGVLDTHYQVFPSRAVRLGVRTSF